MAGAGEQASLARPQWGRGEAPAAVSDANRPPPLAGILGYLQPDSPAWLPVNGKSNPERELCQVT
jgi:hypothetical protein